jgi:hypothetical protein
VSRRLCDCFAATVQLFRRRRSTRQSSPSTWTFNRGHTRRCRGGCVTASRRPCSYFGGGARHDNQARRPGLSTEGTRGGQPRAHAAVSRRLCDCFAATVQLFRRRRSTRQSSPSTWTFNRGHTRRCRGGCVTASRRPCSYFGGGARHDNQARRPGLSTEGTRGGDAAVV